jgi:hypothetical protein
VPPCWPTLSARQWREWIDGRALAPNPAGESFQRFVANERDEARQGLSDLVNDPGLATLKVKP